MAARLLIAVLTFLLGACAGELGDRSSGGAAGSGGVGASGVGSGGEGPGGSGDGGASVGGGGQGGSGAGGEGQGGSGDGGEGQGGSGDGGEGQGGSGDGGAGVGGEGQGGSGDGGAGSGGGPAIYPEAPGTEIVDLSTCSGAKGYDPALAGNTSSPVTAVGKLTFAVWLAQDGKPVVTAYDGKTCTAALNLDTSGSKPGDASHSAPSIIADGDGYLYTFFYGDARYDGKMAPSPYMRRSVRPLDVSAWGPQETARLFTYAEVHGQQLRDGSVLVAGTDMKARIDIIEKGGAYRWPYARQLVAQDTNPSANPPGCRSGPDYLNRFTKTVVHEGPDGTLYAAWGWASGYYPGNRPSDLCGDIRHYTEDAHELYFAYSKDGGLTWKNHAGTRTVSSVLCSSYQVCESPSAGILFNDPDFQLRTQRQREHRRIWAEPDGTIYLAYERSTWCDSGTCNQGSSTATNPGALMLLKFKVGGAIEERLVDAGDHTYIAGIRKAGGKLYIWARENQFTEYVSSDDGKTWSKSNPVPGSNGRLHGASVLPGLNSVRMLMDKSASPRTLHLFKRAF